jgi:heterodisulfide reductase subunit C
MSRAKPNFELRDRIVSKLGGRQLIDCYQCIRCTSGCTALKLLELKPHEIVKLVNLGLVEDLPSSDIIWTCVTCLKCVQRCPQKASPYHVMVALRNVAVERGAKVPEGYLKIVSQILETGLAELPQKIVTRKMETVDRESVKLPKIKPPKQSFQAAFMKAMEEK